MSSENDDPSTEQRPVFEVAPSLKRELAEKQDCFSCGSPFATPWSTTDGKAWLCRECANLHGLGCP